MSERIDHILFVLESVRRGKPTSSAEAIKLRLKACFDRAKSQKIERSTVKDACCRQLRADGETYTIRTFDDDVWAWLSNGDTSLRDRMERHVSKEEPDKDLAAIARVFGDRTLPGIAPGDATAPGDPVDVELADEGGWIPLHDACRVRIEREGAQLLLEVEEVEEPAHRMRGLNALLHWASRAFGISEVGVRSADGKFDYLTEPLDARIWGEPNVGDLLHDALEDDPWKLDVRARLRIVLRTGSFDEVRSMLPWVMGWPPGKVVVQHACEALRARRLTFSEEQVADFYLSLRVKPLVLLAGISGTGKSLLPRCFAEAFGFECTTIPVRPDWSDPGDLVGYRNLKNAFVPGRLLRPIVQAWRQPDRPFFVMLDEMNLARVEHYFADVLSVIETRQVKDGRVVTDPLLTLSPDDEIQGDAQEVAALREVLRQGPLGLPPNLTFIGTVNMDESTHPFSKKVLDRAMTLEFTIGDDDLQRALSPAAPKDPPPSGAGAPSAGPTPLGALVQPDPAKVATVVDALVALNRPLKLCSAQVGYRVRDEVCRYVWLAVDEGVLPEHDALDLALHHKLLPRLQGGRELEPALRGLVEETSTRGLRRCREKLEEMSSRLRDTGYTSFWA